MMERISAAYCLFWEIGRSFREILGRSHFVRVRGRREAYDGLKEVMFSRTADGQSLVSTGEVYLECERHPFYRLLWIHRVVLDFPP